MEYTEITAKVPTKDVETASAIANMTVPYGIYVEDYNNLEEDVMNIAHIDLIDEDLLQKDRNFAIIHMYISECDNPLEAVAYLKERFTASDIDYQINTETVDDSNWNENWKKYFKAFSVGEKLAVCPSWETYNNIDNRTVISLDPGAAFGTGSHATTYLCLTELEKYVTPDSEILDVGTGSGILSIAALLLGAKSAVGVDIDELSVKTANQNAMRNGVGDMAEFKVGNLAEKVSGKYDIICANIVADVILMLFDSVKNFMKPDTKFLVSGIIDIRSREIEAAAKQAGFKTLNHLTREEWHEYTFVLEDE